MGRAEDPDRNVVYLVDFGLAKEHIDNNTGKPFPERKHTDFRGTIPYASLSAHMKKELCRKDDIWSLFFVILEFFDQPLPWKTNTNKDEVRDQKQKCFKKPTKFLFPLLNDQYLQIGEVFDYLSQLNYRDEPDYQLIRNKLHSIQQQVNAKNIQIQNQRERMMLQSLNHIHATAKQNQMMQLGGMQGLGLGGANNVPGSQNPWLQQIANPQVMPGYATGTHQPQSHLPNIQLKNPNQDISQQLLEQQNQNVSDNQQQANGSLQNNHQMLLLFQQMKSMIPSLLQQNTAQQVEQQQQNALAQLMMRQQLINNLQIVQQQQAQQNQIGTPQLGGAQMTPTQQAQANNPILKLNLNNQDQNVNDDQLGGNQPGQAQGGQKRKRKPQKKDQKKGSKSKLNEDKDQEKLEPESIQNNQNQLHQALLSASNLGQLKPLHQNFDIPLPNHNNNNIEQNLEENNINGFGNLNDNEHDIDNQAAKVSGTGALPLGLPTSAAMQSFSMDNGAPKRKRGRPKGSKNKNGMDSRSPVSGDEQIQNNSTPSKQSTKKDDKLSSGKHKGKSRKHQKLDEKDGLQNLFNSSQPQNNLAFEDQANQIQNDESEGQNQHSEKTNPDTEDSQNTNNTGVGSNDVENDQDQDEDQIQGHNGGNLKQQSNDAFQGQQQIDQGQQQFDLGNFGQENMNQ